uniref:Uncharacterized protein n=1 Tax=Anguilla anguilla TaxID=7936 RepID=A0A0E9RPG9_ANGAN
MAFWGAHSCSGVSVFMFRGVGLRSRKVQKHPWSLPRTGVQGGWSVQCS